MTPEHGRSIDGAGLTPPQVNVLQEALFKARHKASQSTWGPATALSGQTSFKSRKHLTRIALEQIPDEKR